MTVYEEDCVCQASGAFCKCNPQITDGEVKHLLHVSHRELQSVDPDSYPADTSSSGVQSDTCASSDMSDSVFDLLPWY